MLAPRRDVVAVRILIDQSGYDLLNLGDVAMLQSCVARLQVQWPSAEIMVIAHDPHRLANFCPGTVAIRAIADLPLFRLLPRRTRLVFEQAWKITAPWFSRRFGREQSIPGQSRTAIQAVYAADLVVASGGAYLTGTWWWHAAGVLSLLSLAQRLGKPTAMFGQGIGPMARYALRAQTRTVLPRLTVLGLREDRMGRPLALSLGTPPDAVMVTGDDALELVDISSAADGNALGMSVRVSDYAGVDLAAATTIGDIILEMAATLDAPVVALPVSKHTADADVLRMLFQRHRCSADVVVDDVTSPEALISAAANCRVIVTGSYHAAVFGLAQGVPAVCLTKSPYYDAKFGGLQALFPGACIVVSLDVPDFPRCLRTAIRQAWQLPASARTAARDTAVRLRDAGREAYVQFRVRVDEKSPKVTADR
jgi:polysaccharide pyruvyl transferase WcaK-like protein